MLLITQLLYLNHKAANHPRFFFDLMCFTTHYVLNVQVPVTYLQSC